MRECLLKDMTLPSIDGADFVRDVLDTSLVFPVSG